MGTILERRKERVSMLDGLELVDWTRLKTAYGPAEQTPRQLRALLSESPEERKRAFAGLANTLIHQSTIYDATLHAVPFLLELLALPSFAEKEDVLRLLADCAEGGFPDRYIVEANCCLSELDTPTPEQRRELAQRQALPEQTRTAVRAGKDIYARLLADADVAVRQAALTVLMEPGVVLDRAWLATVLRSRLSAEVAEGAKEAEADPGMRVALTRFLGGRQPLDATTQALLTRCWQRDADPLVRLAAAVALATGLREDAPPEVADDLAATLTDDLAPFDMDVARRYNDAVFYMDAVGHRRGDDMDFTLDLALALDALGAHGRAVALPRLTRALAARCAELGELIGREKQALPAGYLRLPYDPHGSGAGDNIEQEQRIYVRYGFESSELQLAKALLTLTFGAPRDGEDRERPAAQATDLSPEQRAALASLLACEVIWRVDAILRVDTIGYLLSERGLPYTREALRDFLAQARREQA